VGNPCIDSKKVTVNPVKVKVLTDWSIAVLSFSLYLNGPAKLSIKSDIRVPFGNFICHRTLQRMILQIDLAVLTFFCYLCIIKQIITTFIQWHEASSTTVSFVAVWLVFMGATDLRHAVQYLVSEHDERASEQFH
jgi:hypothetical protein